jgi:hypothetical protein
MASDTQADLVREVYEYWIRGDLLRGHVCDATPEI